jgi:hypothetical protein
MLCRKKLLMLIPVALLVPVLLAMTPLNMAHKFANEVSLAAGKQCKFSSDHCPFHSIVSQGDFSLEILSSPTSEEELPRLQEVFVAVPDSFHSNIFYSSIPLRC